MRALIAEDDPTLAADVARALSGAGFITDVVSNGEDAWFRGDVEAYDIIVLDLGLPRLDGLSVLKRWRAAERLTPVLILSAREAWTEKVEGIESGADDYVGKPFEMGELIARVRALVRRAAGRASALIQIGRLTIDTRRMAVSIDAREVRLSPLEFRLIDYLAHQPRRAVSAGELAEHLYGMTDITDTNAIEALITRLRRKFGAEVIVTRRGFGYLLQE